LWGEHGPWFIAGAGGAHAALLPFGTVADAEAYAAEHTGSQVIDYQAALDSV
jgi:hypothetical protein